MADSPLILIWVLASELASPGTAAMYDAASRVAGSEAVVRIDAVPGDESAALDAVRDTALGVVWLTWDGRKHRHANLDFYLPHTDRRLSRDLSFAPEDPEWERGRTLGFFIASIVLGRDPVPPPLPDERVDEPSETEHAESTEPESAPLPTAVRLAIAGSAAGQRDANGYGGWLGADYLWGRHWGVGLFAEARFIDLANFAFDATLLGVGVSGTWYPVQFSDSALLGLRASVGLIRLDVDSSEVRPTDLVECTADSCARFVGNTEAVIQGTYALSDAFGLQLDLGSQFTFGKTDISVSDEVSASLPIVNPLVRFGAHVVF